MENNQYTMKSLRQALSEAGLPCSKKTILEYERKGVLSKPSGVINWGGTNYRSYTLEEIEVNVQRVREYTASVKQARQESMSNKKEGVDIHVEG